MRYRQYDKIEQQILGSDTGSIRYRWKWGRLVICDPDLTDENGRLRKGAIETLIARAAEHGTRLSRSEVKYRVQLAKTYPTEAQIGQVLGQFRNWSDLIQARFPAVEAPEDEQPYDPQAPRKKRPEDEQPYDPRPPHEKRDDATRRLNQIMNSPEAHGQDPLPGMRMYLPGFTPDTVGRETLFREAFKIHRYICEEVTPQLRKAASQAERDDREREAKLNRLFDATNRNLDASLGEGEDALDRSRSGE